MEDLAGRKKNHHFATVQNKVCYLNCITEFAIQKLIINQNDEVYCKLKKKKKKSRFWNIFEEKNDWEKNV